MPDTNTTDETTLFVTCPREVEGLLVKELETLGIKASGERGGVRLDATIEDAYRICLWSRIANRVLYPLGTFKAESPEQLYEGVSEIDWTSHFDVGDTIAVDALAIRSNINHNQFAAQTIKDGIVDRFRNLVGERPSVQLKTPDIRINGYIYKDLAQIYLDLSGDSLHMRGYRSEGGTAPLKENLAAAILMRANWPELADQGYSFVDFMCGSGTLLIEAAQMSLDIAPGLTREHFGFLKWQQHKPEVWSDLLEEARERREAGVRHPGTIVGFDNHRATIGKAQENVLAANLDSVIKIEYQDVTNFHWDSPKQGLVAINPPYGKRLGDGNELTSLYRAIGGVLRNSFTNWRAAMLTNDLSMGKHIGIRTRKIHTLYNGPMKCKLLHFEVDARNFFKDSRLPGFVDPGELSDNAVMFRNRLIKNRKKLAKWAAKEEVACYRLYDADLPEYAVAVDLYRGTHEWLHVQEYQAPKSVDPEKAKWRAREALTVLRDLFDADESCIFYKNRRRQRGREQYQKLARTEIYHEVQEGNSKLLVNFEDYLDTGLFLDHRPTRSLIRNLSAGKSFLNLFAYTGSMTVAAAMGGARTTSVDLSANYLDWARRNMELNGLDGPEHRYLREDCLGWLKRSTRDRYDLIFLDPPTFSNSTSMSSHLDIQEHHGHLIDLAMGLLNTGGELYFSVNARKFRLDSSLADRYKVHDITHKTIPRDFSRRPRIHSCWVISA